MKILHRPSTMRAYKQWTGMVVAALLALSVVALDEVLPETFAAEPWPGAGLAFDDVELLGLVEVLPPDFEVAEPAVPPDGFPPPEDEDAG